MDHLPYPQHARYPRVKIPYLGSDAVEKYGGDNFCDFPLRVGWREGDQEWFDCDPGIAAARTQSWLFFGLLREVLGPAFDEASYIVSDGEHKLFVSTKTRLLPLLRKAFRLRAPFFRYFGRSFSIVLLYVATLPISFFFRDRWSRLHDRLPKLRSQLMYAMIEAEKQVRRVEVAFPDCEDVHLVCLSVRALLWSLRNAIANRNFTALLRSSVEISSSVYLKHLLVERGICPHYLSVIEPRSSTATLHYLAGLDRPFGVHQDCTSQVCIANILDPSKYETKHVNDDCRCESVGPDTAEIRRLIDLGEVPIIRTSISEHTVHLEVQQAAFGVPYVAISHVWSGGLGNQQTLSLPTCQLRRICSLLSPLTKPSKAKSRVRWYGATKILRSNSEKDAEIGTDQPAESCVFWMDTLCLPKERPQRDLAINQMSRIYAGAQQVVVLDTSLQRMATDTLETEEEEEILANVVSSSWMSRCWTYQEGRLAERLLVAIGHSLRDPFVLYNKAAWQVSMFERCMGTWSDTLQLHREMASALYRMRPLKDDTRRRKEFQNFVNVWNELVSRTTSWPEDVITIFTLMLGLSVGEVQRIPAAHIRLRAILRTQESLPVSFLLDQPAAVSSTSSSDGEHPWVPEALAKPVDAGHGSLLKMADIGTGERGFVVDLTERFLLVKSVSKSSGRSLDLCIDSDKWQPYKIRLALPEVETSEDSACDSRLNTCTNDLYLICGPDWHTTALLGYSDRGCRFTVVEEEPTYMIVDYDCSFSYTVIHNSKDLVATGYAEAASQKAELIDQEVDIRLRCDWEQWPSLQYQRSTSAERMTSSHGPTHPYVVLLFYWEIILGGVSIIGVITIFPNAVSRSFWFDASPAEKAIWALCLIGLIGRLYFVLMKECPALNKRLKSIEYQKWTESFNQQAVSIEGSPHKGSPIYTYQYSSLWVVAGLAIPGIALLATGLSVGQPNLYDVAFVGGYLLSDVSSRLAVEAFWRCPGIRCGKRVMLRLIQGSSIDGYPSLNPLLILRSFYPSSETVRRNPGFIAHRRNNLDDSFEDPLYLPEDFSHLKSL